MTSEIVSYDNKSNWSYWRTFALRTAGFSFNAFTSNEEISCSHGIEKVVEVEAKLASLWGACSEHLQGEIFKHKSTENVDGDRNLKNLRRAFKHSKKRLFSELLKKSVPAHIVNDLLNSIILLDKLQEDYSKSYNMLYMCASNRIKSALNNEKFTRALTWQNIDLIKFINSKNVFSNGRKPSKVREIENVITSYIQRYTTKNETIGDFGPVGWGKFDNSDLGIMCYGVNNEVKARNRYFEDWSIAAIAKKMSNVEALLPWARVRVSPLCRVNGTEITFPFSRKSILTAEEANILPLCDGTRIAKDIFNTLYDKEASTVERDVYHALRTLMQKHVIRWEFNVPYYSSYPLNDLLKQIESIPPKLLGKFKELEKFQLFDFNSSNALEISLSSLNVRFEELSGVSSIRNRGKSYASRTICFEDCVQGLSVKIGGQLMAQLDQPLSLVLDSADWFVEQVAALYSKLCLDKFVQLTSTKDIVELPFVDFWLHISNLFFNEGPLPIDNIVTELQARWQSVLMYTSESEELTFQYSSLNNKVKEMFNSTGGKWPQATHHSPDIMIDAFNKEAINERKFYFVLGEVHVAYNTLMANFLINQSDEHNKLHGQYHEDIQTKRILPVFSPGATGVPMRTRWALDSKNSIELLFSPDSVPQCPETAINIADLYVACDSSGLMAHSHNGEHSFKLLDILGEFLSHLSVTKFNLFPKNKHLPRVLIDNLIINRKSWSFKFELFGSMTSQEPKYAFLELNKWRIELEIPDQIYVRVNWEKKPVFVDFNCPISVRIFLKLVRKGYTECKGNYVSFSEMKPDKSGIWLNGNAGSRFTSEFRVVAKRK